MDMLHVKDVCKLGAVRLRGIQLKQILHPARCSHPRPRVGNHRCCPLPEAPSSTAGLVNHSTRCFRAKVVVQATRRRTSKAKLDGKVTGVLSSPSTSTADFPPLLQADIDTEYLEVAMHKCRFLMAILDDHLLLDNVRIMDDETGVTSRAHVDIREGPLPQQAHRYQFVPWMRHISGDQLKYEEDEYQLLKMFLVKKKTDSDILDLQTVVCLDAEARQLGIATVERMCAADVPEENLSLRIREGLLTLEQSDMMPPPGEVVGKHSFGSSPTDEEDSELPQQELIPASSELDVEEMEDDMDIADDAPAVDLA